MASQLPSPGSARLRASTESQAALFRQTRDFLVALAAECPVVLFLDDLHWADQPSLDLLRFLGPWQAEWQVSRSATAAAAGG